ncbi:hypothetical protein C0J52_26887 [Blattella germanica]|nr:hypothetical protein C0J52_26887 [Blattella germanica]
MRNNKIGIEIEQAWPTSRSPLDRRVCFCRSILIYFLIPLLVNLQTEIYAESLTLAMQKY